MENPRILIVDDDRFVRRTILRVMQSEGMIPQEAASGPEAIALVSKQSFDLILLDIIMEGMDGFQVIHQMRSLGITTPVFILSGRQADNDKVFALGLGADDYITKPFSPAVLCAKVKACLRREMRCNGPLLQRLRSLADSAGDVTVIIHKNTALLCFVHLLFKIQR